jgi:hypothetical protein
VPVDDPPALAAALGQVLDDPDLAGRLRQEALGTSERFTWARSAAEHQVIYAALGSALSTRPGQPILRRLFRYHV